MQIQESKYFSIIETLNAKVDLLQSLVKKYKNALLSLKELFNKPIDLLLTIDLTDDRLNHQITVYSIKGKTVGEAKLKINDTRENVTEENLFDKVSDRVIYNLSLDIKKLIEEDK